MDKLSAVKSALQTLDKAGIHVSLVEVDPKDREELIFQMFRMSRGSPNATREMSRRFMGELKIYGVEITAPQAIRNLKHEG